MNVRELKIILEHLPDDLPVHVISSGHAAHIRQVERAIGGHNRRGARYWPPSLILRGGRVWFDPEPDYELSGPFRRKAEMLGELDALEGINAP